MSFWIVTALMALAAALIVALPLLRARKGEADESHAAALADIEVYRQQLKDLERDVARGTLPEEEAARARTEISRRLLEADRRAAAEGSKARAPRSATLAMAGLATLAVLGGGFALYLQLGANRPGQPIYPDMGLAERKAAAEELRKTRPSQAQAEAQQPAWQGPGPEVPADYVALIEKLRKTAAQNPDDLRGQELLASHEAQIGNLAAAWQAKQRVIALKGNAASADDYAELADLMVVAAGGYISPEAEAAIEAALARDPQHPIALYYKGLLDAQIGRPDLAFPIWRDLLEQSPPDAPWVAPIRTRIDTLAALAGQKYSPPGAPGALPGPSAGDMAAAADMTDEERNAMVQSMVDRLAERLDAEGGTPAEWARLIRALGVLGDQTRAAQAWAKARKALSGDPQGLAQVAEVARQVGLDTAAAPAQGATQGSAAPAAAPAGPLPGPSAEDIAAAAQMSEADRAQMVQDMVARMMDRLATQGGTAAEWAQLVRALGVLGDTARARAIWSEAQATFAGRPDQLAVVRAAAIEAGVADGAAAPALSAAERRALDNEATDLADRLASQGGSAQDWARLISLYAELGETARARAAWDQAQMQFAPLSGELAEIRTAARAAGVAQ